MFTLGTKKYEKRLTLFIHNLSFFFIIPDRHRGKCGKYGNRWESEPTTSVVSPVLLWKMRGFYIRNLRVSPPVSWYYPFRGLKVSYEFLDFGDWWQSKRVIYSKKILFLYRKIFEDRPLGFLNFRPWKVKFLINRFLIKNVYSQTSSRIMTRLNEVLN